MTVRPSTDDAVAWAEEGLGLSLETWQAKVMTSTARRFVLLACRQSGKSSISAARAAWDAASAPGSVTLMLSSTLRQSVLLAEKAARVLERHALLAKSTTQRLELQNGAVVHVLPGDDPDKLRGFTADLVVLDESGYVRRAMAAAIYPALVARQGRLAALSTPGGTSGLLYDLWTSEGVERLRVPASEVTHLDQDFIADLRLRLGPLARAELDAEFLSGSGGLFHEKVLEAMFGSEIPEPVAPEVPPSSEELERLRRRAEFEASLDPKTGRRIRTYDPKTGETFLGPRRITLRALSQ